MTTALASAPLALHHLGPRGYGHGFGFPWPVLFMPLFWLAVIVVVGLVFGRRWRRAAASRGTYGPRFGWGGPSAWGGRGPWGGPGSWAAPGAGVSAAEHTLADRFARGDIDEVEYRARLEVLRAGQQPPTGPWQPPVNEADGPA